MSFSLLARRSLLSCKPIANVGVSMTHFRWLSTAAASPKLDSTTSTSMPELKSITKIIAETGVCSRHEAEQFVMQGRVTINGDKCLSPMYKLETNASDNISIDGVKLKKKYVLDRRSRLWAIRKRDGEVVGVEADPKQRPLLMTRFMGLLNKADVDGSPDGFKPVNRLEYSTEGLSLFSNSGDLARVLNSDLNLGRQYRLRVHGLITESKLEGLRKGLFIDGIKYKPMDVEYQTKAGTITWLTVTCYENRNQALKKSFEKLFLKITRSICIGFGPYKVDSLFPDGSTNTCVELKLTPEMHAMYLKMQNNRTFATKTRVKQDLGGRGRKPRAISTMEAFETKY